MREHTCETSVSGLYLTGVGSGRGDLIKHAINQGYEVIESLCGRSIAPADEEILRHKVPFLSGPLPNGISALRDAVPFLAEVCGEDLRELLRWSTLVEERCIGCGNCASRS